MHHSDPKMDVSTALRFHTGELLISSAIRLPIILLIGMNYTELLIYETIMMPVIYLHHSNFFIPDKIDRLLRLILVTPWMHWVHHSNIMAETNMNYGTIFSWWDRLVRTFLLKENPSSIIYGVLEFQDENWQTIWGMLKTPFVRMMVSKKSLS
jgi:sterol desaturase/sphingolipid hydroxylase (fatty acid hydroxylase superfamily)